MTRRNATLIAVLVLLATELWAGFASADDAKSLVTSMTSSDQISMEDYSWGHLIWGWKVNADGSGEFTSTAPRAQNFNDRVATVWRWEKSAGHYEDVRKALSETETYAGQVLPCTKTIYDLQYGNVTWRHDGVARVVNFDLGCRSPDTLRLYGQMMAAYKLAAQWALAGTKSEPAAASR